MGMTIEDIKQECRYCYREVDASGLEAFRCTNKTVNMETSWCRPKNANEPCSICEYCKPREEMEMTIDKTIDFFNGLECYTPQAKDARDVAIETMRKYQKIVDIVTYNPVYIHHTDMDTYKLNSIRGVLEDGKID